MAATADGCLPRVLVVGRTLPIQATGTALMTRRLLEHFGGDEIVFLGRTPDARRKTGADGIPYPLVEVPAAPQGGRAERFWMLLALPVAMVLGLRAIRRYGVKAILAIYPDEGALLTGLLLKAFTGLPLAFYFCDLYMEEVRSGWQGWLARRLQPLAFRKADRLLALTGGMVEYYRREYGLSVDWIPHCINTPLPAPLPLPPAGERLQIAYSGNVNAARLDALRQMTAAIGGDPAYHLRYFSPNSQADLERRGVWIPNASVEFLRGEAALLEKLAECDILYLPVAFQPGDNSAAELETAFGTKTLEYLVSQRPILLHCPPHYYLADFIRSQDCGVVVAANTPAALRQALETLRGDAALRQRLAHNGLQAARLFDGQRVAGLLRDCLQDLTASA